MKTKMVYMGMAVVLVFSLVAVIVPASPISAQTTWYVDDDTCPAAGSGTAGDPFCKIQDAIDAANPAGGDTIIVAPGTYNEHDIAINKSLTIQGAGAGSTFIDGQDISRVFYINQSTVDMSGMTIRSGNTTADGGGIFNNSGNVTITNCTVSDNYAEDNGGGIYNDGTLTLTNCTISGNYNWLMDGGGIYNDGTLTLTNCTISGNYASSDDGGGINNYGGNVTLTNCTVSDNYAADDGGGIRNVDTLTMTGCTISGNNAVENGGGIYNVDTLTMTGCTISGNHATGNGSGVYISYGDVIITNCTISGNTAGYDGGGIYNLESHNLTITNCTITQNKCDNDGGGVLNNYQSLPIRCTIVYGNTRSGGGADNFDGTYTDPSNESIIGGSVDPLLGPLRDNGGPTETHALLTGSAAIDACINGCTVVTDQRGLPRPMDGDLDGIPYCDIGAYEKQISVGGIVEPVDRLELLAPWLALAALMAVSLLVVVAMRRRHLT